ncbi:glycosyltransferase family 2 protein [uncultured Methanobrevibacter sp.]|uniref:glycosyltransferase family 2 protein n=1 Tax=uncultured Methanobrevibacter sp. TaxID=253161 RepID=UPI0025D28833|nr:glycosyltransferase family 2 protein [uncultured Methanobrevibacter sp.]
MINFSLIIPIYNKEKVLQTTLDSIVENHDIPDEEFECILVNESSTDNSENICKVYSEKYKYIKYYNIINDGIRKPSNARNFGKRVAIGKHIMFLDADDLLCKNFMLSAVNFLNNHNEYDFYLCNRYINNVYMLHVVKDFIYYGPTLSCCIFKKYVVDSLDFENIINEDIVYTKKLMLAGYTYYYDINNLPSYTYITDNSEMVQSDINYVQQYDNWICGPAEILQYSTYYNYCISDDKRLINKDNKKIDNINISLIHSNTSYTSDFNSVFNTVNRKCTNIDFIVHELNVIKKFRDEIKTITFINCENTLHPKLECILTIARKIFPNNEICVVMNGSTYKQLYASYKSIVQNNVICKVLVNSNDEVNQIREVCEELVPSFNLRYINNDIIYDDNTSNEIKTCNKKKELDGNKLLYSCCKMNDKCMEINGDTTIDDILNFENSCYDCEFI